MPTLFDIAKIGNPVLRRRAEDVASEQIDTPEFQGFVDSLVATMRHANGAGLAANQVHHPIRVCAIEVGDNPRYPYKPKIPLTILINPVLTPIGNEQFDNYEGCLSVPDLRGVVRRWAEIRVQALTRTGERFEETIRGITAGTFQHEVDHLDGVLFVDRVSDPQTLCTWAEFARHRETDFRKRVEAIVQRYGS
jgi:peptide deformylase